MFFADNFKLPEEGELFNNVSFVGVNKEEAEEIVKKYNKEGRDARARDERPYGRGFGGRDHGDRMQSYGRPPMGGYRQRCKIQGVFIFDANCVFFLSNECEKNAFYNFEDV